MSNHSPIFSILVRTRGRPAPLKARLESREALAYPREDLEAIVVGDGSARKLDDIVGPAQQSIGVVLFRIGKR
jgi:hypothetical protein